MDILTTLQALNACHGPSGDEGGVADMIRTLAAPYADNITTDAMGNLIVHKKGIGPKVMLAAHMDSIGCIATFVEEKGFVRFGRLGGLDVPELLATPVRFKNGVRGVIRADEHTDHKDLNLDKLFIDIGAENEEEAKAQVCPGDTAVFDTPVQGVGRRILSPYLDNRIACVILLMVLEQLRDRSNDLYFIFTVQEEVGLRGARTAAYAIDPDYAIAVDVTDSDDTPGAKHDGTAVLGKGAAIKVMDGSVLCHPSMVSKLRALAEEKGIQAQTDIIRSGGTDAGAIHQIRGGVVTGGVSVPCRYIHSPQEMVDTVDVEACAALIAAFVQSKLD